MEANTDAVDKLLAVMAERVREAQASKDPIERTQIAASLQWRAAWLTRFAVDDCRRAGLSWPQLADSLGIPQSTLFEQHSAGGPVVAVRPHRGTGKRNDHWIFVWNPRGQNELRIAATNLVHLVMTPNPAQDTPTGRGLYLAVHAMQQAQLNIETPEPLLNAVDEVLRTAEKIAAEHPETAEDASIWVAVNNLRHVYLRDRQMIAVAAEVAAVVRLPSAAEQEANAT
jgi:hypothetical protein